MQLDSLLNVDLAAQLSAACPDGLMLTSATSGVTKHRLAEVLNDWALSISRMLPSDGSPRPVVVSLPHGPQFLAAIAATWTSGNAIAPLSLRATRQEIQKCLNTLRPFRIACEAGDSRFEAADSSLETVSLKRGIKILGTNQLGGSLLKQGDALLATTSGTTGEAKCAVLSASAVLANCLSVRNYLELTKADRVLVFTPTHFTYAMVQLLSAVLSDATVLSGSYGLLNPPSLTAFAQECGMTGVSANPTSYEMWLPSISQQGNEVRYVLSAGQPLRKRLFDKLTGAFPSAVQISGYGCTENVNRISFAKITSPGPFRNSIASVGWPIPGTTVVLDPNTSEIVLGGSSLMEGYFQDLGAGLERINSYNTGDLGVLGEAGDLYLTGRITTRMNVGNEMVDPEEVEAAILLVPSITECAVGPLPDDLLGEAIGALIVLEDKTSQESIKTEIRSTLAGVLRRSRWPHHIREVSTHEIPRTSYGKVNRKELKRQLEATFGPDADPKRKATKL